MDERHNTRIERVGPWVIVKKTAFLAGEVIAVWPRPWLMNDEVGCQVELRNGTTLHCPAEALEVWKIVAGPLVDDAVSLNPQLGTPKELP